MAVKSLQRLCIGIDNLQRLLGFTRLCHLPRGIHITLAASLRAAMLTIASHNLIGTSHLVLLGLLCIYRHATHEQCGK